MLADRERDREAGGTGRFERGRFLESLPIRSCTAWPIALYAERGPDPNELAGDRVRIGVDQCLLALEADRLEDEIRFNAGELARGPGRRATRRQSPDCSKCNAI